MARWLVTKVYKSLADSLAAYPPEKEHGPQVVNGRCKFVGTQRASNPFKVAVSIMFKQR